MDRQPEWVTLNRLHPKESIDRPQEVMFHLPSPSSLISPESIRSAMPPDGEIDFGRDVEEEEEEEVGSGDNEEEVLSGTNETTENCKDIIEEPKVGMEFDTSNEAYEYYLRYAKQ